MQRVTGKKPSVTRDLKRHGVYVVVYDKELWRMCETHGGRYAAGKRFSKAVMDLPPERQKLAVDTYYKGDGSVARIGNMQAVRAATISRQLAFQLQELLALRGVYAGWARGSPQPQVHHLSRTQ